MTPEVLQASCLIGQPEHLIEQLKKAEEEGLTEVTIVPPTANAGKVMHEFEQQVMRRY